MKKIISTLIILVLSMVFTISAYAKHVDVGCYNVESGTFKRGVAKVEKRYPDGYPRNIKYDTIDETNIKYNNKEVPELTKGQIIEIATCIDFVFNNGIDVSGNPIVYKNFGRVYSLAYQYSPTIESLVVDRLASMNIGLKPKGLLWVGIGNKKGKTIEVYLEILREDKSKKLSESKAYIYGTTDTLMQPNKALERQECCAMIYRLLKQNDQLDGYVPTITTAEYWSKNAIEYMKHIGIYDKTPSLYASISRGEAFKIMCIALGYTDILDETYEDYASILQDKRYVIGYENGELGLDRNITRAEFCKIYNMVIGRDFMKLKDKKGNFITAEYYNIKDIKKGDWYYDIILKATSSYNGQYVDISLRGTRNEVDGY